MTDAAREVGRPSGKPSELVGKQIAGRYRIEEGIGRGGMAVVYRAWDENLNRTVALKLLAPEYVHDDVFRQRFIHESQVAAAIDHPHIVPVFDADETEGRLYIAMRYVPGEDLRALIRREGPLPAATTVRIAAQVASALDAAHHHELVHRDVTPGNILVSEGTDSEHPEHVYLTDFGLTKKSQSLTGFTTVGTFMGTANYMSPEQISGRPVDGRCDVYGLGCVIYEALTGAPPFERDDDMALLWAHQFEAPPPLTDRRPDLPVAVDAVAAKALAKAPEDRYGTCGEFVAELRAATMTPFAPQEQPGASRTVTHTEPTPPPQPPDWARPVFRGRI